MHLLQPSCFCIFVSLVMTFVSIVKGGSLFSTKLSDHFEIMTTEQDHISYATAFVIVNTKSNPALPWMTCYIDNEKLVPLQRPDPTMVIQLRDRWKALSSQYSNLFYHVYRMPFLSEERSYIMRIGASASRESKEDSLIFSVPLHITKIQVSSLSPVEYPVAHIQNEATIILEGKDLEWDDKI